RGQGLRADEVRVHDAKEAEGLNAVVDIPGGGHGRHVHYVKQLRFKALFADDDAAFAPEHHDDVLVLLFTQGRMHAGADLKVAYAEGARLPVAASHHLAGDVLPAFAGVLALVEFVFLQLLAVPAIVERVETPEQLRRLGFYVRHGHAPPVYAVSTPSS